MSDSDSEKPKARSATAAKNRRQTPQQKANKARHNARRLVVQALYQRAIAGHNLTQLLKQYEEDAQRADKTFLEEALTSCIDAEMDYQLQLEPLLDREEEQIDAIERAVLLLAAYELTYRIEIPYRVVINEAVELAKEFGAEGSWRYVNGVLDKLASEVRTIEKQSANAQ